MPGDLTTWGSIASWAWEKRDEIARSLRDFYSWMRKSNDAKSQKKILIIGPGGVGKTTLARMLSGEFDWLQDSPWEYRESFGTETNTIPGSPALPFIVAPGQTVRRNVAWTEFESEIASGNISGIILCTANGYHSPSQRNPVELTDFQNSKKAFRKAYLNTNREDEFAIYQRMAPHIRSAPNRLWVLSLVTKADLWASDQATVVALFDSGRFGSLIQDLAKSRGLKQFRHEFATCSLIVSRLLTSDQNVLFENEAGYDHRHSIESIRRVIEIITALNAWGTQHDKS